MAFGIKFRRKGITNYKLQTRLSVRQAVSSNRGFSFIETMIVLAIVIVLSAFAYGTFITLNRDRALEKDATSLVLLLGQARAMTLGSKGASQYGVHFGDGSAVLFKGPTYSSSDASNVVMVIDSPVTVSSVSLSGGGSDVLFDWLTGNTSQNGTVTLSLNTDSSDPLVLNSKMITIYQTGLAE